MDQQTIITLGTIFIAIIAFLILREVFAWYFKINSRNAKLDRTNDLLELLVKSKFDGDIDSLINQHKSEKKNLKKIKRFWN